MIMSILNVCLQKDIQVWTIKDNYRLGNDINSKVLAFAFGLTAEIERNLISQRTREALARKKTEGVRLGRPKGSKSSRTKLSGKQEIVMEKLISGHSITDISKELKVSKSTLYVFMQEHDLYVKRGGCIKK